jgi:plastocyanin
MLFAAEFALSILSGTAWAQGASVKGKVLFKGDAEKYKRTTLDTAKDPNCKKNKAKIGSYDVILNKKTDPVTIKNVMVFVDHEFSQKFPAPSEPVVLDQKGCEYEPHVFGVVEGQKVTVRNSDETNHNVHFLPKKNEEHNFTQPKPGDKDIVLVAEPKPFKIKCDVHPWMGAYAAVFKHPFFSVTGDEGTFEIKDLPPGKYKLIAWHETFGEVSAEVEVSAGGTEHDFTFEPK